MVYLLSGLLVIHGIVCLLGAFFPFYPPVFFFYYFFPCHFAIKLIIVLLVGAAQLVYGVYLALGKKWRIRWYWLAVATIVITGLLLIFPAYQGLFTRVDGGGVTQPIPTIEPPYPSARPGPERPDDIIPTPGGLTYKANFQQEGLENPWPPIESNEIILASNKYSPGVTYRDYIETKAGESRNNILHINAGGREVNQLNLYTINIPTGIEVKRGIQWQGPRTIAQVLVIEIAQDIQPAEYTFEIGVEINGTDCGAVPCTIKVLESTAGSTPSETTPKTPYPGNHGITTTKVEPKPGESVTMVSGSWVKFTMDDLVEKSDTVLIGKVVDIFPSRQVDKPPWIVITDVVIEVERYLYGQPQSVYIAVMVPGGRVGEMAMLVTDQPVLNLGEEVALFLYRLQSEITPPEGFDPAEYYRVTGSMQGKLGYSDSTMITFEGDSITLSEIEQKIASIHGGK